MKYLFCVFGLILLGNQFGFSQELDSRSKSSFSSSSFTMSGISVTIGGEFPTTGTFPASPSERVDQFVTRIIVQLKNMENYAKRDIVLKHSDGKTEILDLLDFRLSGNFKNNPYLKNDDVLVFPSINFEKNFISIDGAVSKPQKIQFVEGDKLSDIIFLAQGLDPSYTNITSIEIYRTKNDGSLDKIFTLKPTEDMILNRGDRIFVRADINLRYDAKVLVLGEVNNPGYIAVSQSSTTFNDVLLFAGGLKNEASLDYARLLRGQSTQSLLQKAMSNSQLMKRDPSSYTTMYEYYKNMTVADIYEINRMSSLTNEDTLFFNIDNTLRYLQQGDFVSLTDLDNSQSDLSKSIVRDGDVIIIPPKPLTVFLFGQVVRTGRVPWISGKDLSYYLTQAGGLGEEATKDIYLIRGKSKQWIKISEKTTAIEAGDYIWIPKEIKRPVSYYLQLTSYVMGIIGSVATVALLVVQLGK